MPISKESSLMLELNIKGLTNLQISNELDIPIVKVRSTLNRFGYKSNKQETIEVTNELEQFLIGFLLGDGSFTKEGRLSIAHGLEQEEYFMWKYEFLLKYKLVKSFRKNKIISERYSKGYMEEIRFKSLTNPLFREIRESQYINGSKSITSDYIDKIDALALAIWYMDDGFVTDHSFQICSMRYSLEVVKSLQELLKSKFEINTNLNARKEIYILAESKQKFINIVEPFIHTTMKYKLLSYCDR